MAARGTGTGATQWSANVEACWEAAQMPADGNVQEAWEASEYLQDGRC